MRALSKEDFKGFNFKRNHSQPSDLDLLADICGVALEIFEQEKRLRSKTKTNSNIASSRTRISSRPKTKKTQSKTKRKGRPSNFVNRRKAPADPATYAELPEEFRREIEKMAGSEIKLVIQKQLYESDLTPNHNRLLMPFTQIVNRDFLNEEEKARLGVKKEAIGPVAMVMKEEERMEETEIKVRQWEMTKRSGKTSCSYVLRTPWIQVAQRNNLQVDDVVQVWSFRVANALRLALVVVSRAANNHHQLQQVDDSGDASSSGNSNITTEAVTTPPLN